MPVEMCFSPACDPDLGTAGSSALLGVVWVCTFAGRAALMNRPEALLGIHCRGDVLGTTGSAAAVLPG